jgi:hypothetical protein
MSIRTKPQMPCAPLARSSTPQPSSYPTSASSPAEVTTDITDEAALLSRTPYSTKSGMTGPAVRGRHGKSVAKRPPSVALQHIAAGYKHVDLYPIRTFLSLPIQERTVFRAPNRL